MDKVLNNNQNIWSVNSWRKHPICQQPDWSDKEKLQEVLNKLNSLPSLVFSGETRKLKSALGRVNKENSFILQIGNCSESFSDCNGPKIHNYLRIFLQMTMVLKVKTGKDIIKIGRTAGQYAKPRSSDYETVKGRKLPSYRGDIVNGYALNEKARTPDSNRLLEGYFRSATTLNLIRAFMQGGYNDIDNLNDWEEHFFENEVDKLNGYKEFEANISNSLKEMDKEPFPNDGKEQIFISHEGLLLNYEEAFTRLDTTYGGYYDTSAHFIWVGDRTRQIDGAHIEFIRGIGNPIGVKIGPDYDLKKIIEVIKRVNPKNEDGRLVLICRMGYEEIETKLRPLIQSITEHKLQVVWMCDPMHGNTFKLDGFKVRSFDHIVSEIKSFFRICGEEGVVPGGIHLEVTEENVTECIGGITKVSSSDINKNYLTKVDPRLNAAQALELALIVGNLM